MYTCISKSLNINDTHIKRFTVCLSIMPRNDKKASSFEIMQHTNIKVTCILWCNIYHSIFMSYLSSLFPSLFKSAGINIVLAMCATVVELQFYCMLIMHIN